MQQQLSNTVMTDNTAIGLPSDHWDMGALEGTLLELMSQAMYEVEVAASIAGGNSECFLGSICPLDRE